MIQNYWLSPSATLERVWCHSAKGDEEKLMRNGWLRVVVCKVSKSLFFERRIQPTEKQIAVLEELAFDTDTRMEYRQ